MKKKLLPLLIFTIIIFTGCGSKETMIEKETDSINEEVSSSEEEGKIQSKENLLSVEITLPKDYLGDTEITQEDVDKTASDEGFDKATLNEDGSVTYKMSKKKHKEVLEEMKKTTQESCDEMINGENPIESYEKIVFNDDLTIFSVYVDSGKFSDLDTLSAISFYISGGYYQVFNCVPDEDIDVEVDFIDSKTDKVLNTGKLSDTEDSEEPESVITETEALSNIGNWYTDIWNYFVNFQSYRENGMDCTGAEIDIDFAYSEFEEEYKSLEEYDNYISNISDKYSDIKNVWVKMKEQIELIYADVSTNGVKQGGEYINLDLLSQYSSSFRECIDEFN